MAGDDSFLFEKPVGVVPRPEPMEFREPICVHVEMVQNGFELRYENKSFIAETLNEAMDMTRKWFEEKMKSMKSKDKKD